MENEALNCRCCGGVLNVKSSLCVCDYCGATNFISDVASKYTNQLNRANKLRQEREFDNAARIYDVILKENAPTADILWLRTLCEYGIEYVPDPVSDKYFPTLHRINEESILKYPSYTEALSLAEGDEKESLIKEAEYINNIQNEYLHIAENESPYDVFICYKETDEDTGEKTEDVDLAEELYEDLTGKGFKVFFAKETLKDKLSIDYEPYIFAALKSARAMVVLGTKAEYFMSVWVKNEWGRFLKLMQDDNTKQMFFACDDPEELPRAFANKQAQLLGSEGAIKNLANNVEKFLKEKNTFSEKQSEGSLAEKMYNEAISYLRFKNENGANPIIKKLISYYPDYAPGYWARMLNTFKVKPSEITNMPLDLYSNPDYQKAVSLAYGDLKEEYTQIAAECKKNFDYQKEFDEILDAKSTEYVKDYRKSRYGMKKKEITDKLVRYADTIDTCNNRLRLTFALGFFISISGVFLMLFLSWFFDISRIYGFERVTLVIALCAPIFLVGAALLLSYNWVVDLIACVLSGILFAVVAADSDCVALVFLAVLIPYAVYLFTNQSHYLNAKRNIMAKASLEMEKELEELRATVTILGNDLRKDAAKLLKEFKDKKQVTSMIEIKEEEYLKRLKKFDVIYESANEKYTRYIGLSIPQVREKNMQGESWIGLCSLMFLIFPPFTVFSYIVAIIDIVTDKYRERKHIISVSTLVITILLLALVLYLVNTYF